ncbi:SCO-spondin-like [Mya arenaria]|uniref:SCO-spondin-like n=1 Tax=Mya arenaria TaxID=6604 RepID=UPI0022E34F49|nr:SCO-spondin-like [Mya arenaria]
MSFLTNHPLLSDCKVSEWTNWTPCNVLCGIGTQIRERVITAGEPGICGDLDFVEEQICFRSDCTCEPPQVWKNDSLCHSQTCEDMLIDASCSDQLLPACVCPEDMYLKDGECVVIADCYTCVVDGDVKKIGEIWSPTGTCDVCQCVMGEVQCERVMEEPVCEEGEEITYDDGPCCPRCQPIPPTCQLRNKTETINYENCRSTSELTYSYCAGSCGESKSKPHLTLSNGDPPSTDNECSCCQGIPGGNQEVEMRCENADGTVETVVAFMPTLTACLCDMCG